MVFNQMALMRLITCRWGMKSKVSWMQDGTIQLRILHVMMFDVVDLGEVVDEVAACYGMSGGGDEA